MKTSAAALYSDFSSFGRLRAEARDGSASGRRKTAQQIESMFLGMMLKSMRAAGGSMLGGTGAKVREGMFDSQLALSMSKHSRLGFADMMLREFNLRQGPAQDAAPGKSTEPVTGAFADSLWGRRISQNRGAVEANMIRPTGRPLASPPVSAVALPPAVPSAGIDNETQSSPIHWHNADEFAARLWPAAQRAAKALGTQPQAVLAIAALETGWGKHMPTSLTGGKSNNLFGIKAHGWAGPTTYALTLEFESGHFVHKLEPFRHYVSAQQSFDDFVQFIKNRPRYAGALDSGGDPAAFVQALQRAGYATDPGYAAKLETLMHSETMRKAQAVAASGPGEVVT